MPWCPVCKNEYKTGYKVCADCGAELVESLEERMKAVYFGQQDELYDICDFMRANGITDTEVSYDESEETYELLVDAEQLENAQKMIRVYLQKIAEPKAMEEAASMEAALSQEQLLALLQEREARMEELNRVPYEDAQKKAEDYKNGADSLLIVGIIGVILLVLLNLNVFPIYFTAMTKLLVTGVMGVLFIVFIVMGIMSRKSYNAMKLKATSDNNVKEDIINYLKDNVVPEEFDKDLMDDEPTMEILYFRRMEKLKGLVNSYSEEIDASFAEYILEEVYSEIFE